MSAPDGGGTTSADDVRDALRGILDHLDATVRALDRAIGSARAGGEDVTDVPGAGAHPVPRPTV